MQEGVKEIMQAEEKMTLDEHLGELRKRIIWILLVIMISMIIGFVIAQPVIDFFRQLPSANGMQWNVFSPWDPVRVYMQFAFMTALIISFPFILYQIWAYFKPGLRENEQKATLWCIPAALLLFLVGLSFAYFVVFPLAIHFSLLITNHMSLEQTFGITQYFTFMFNIVLPISFVFELPLVVIFLTQLRILNPNKMKGIRKYAYILILIIGSIVTPPDVISAIVVSIPIVILFEISTILSKIIYRKQVKEDKLWTAKFDS